MSSDNITTIFFDWGGVIANDPGDDFLSQLLREIGANDAQVQEIFVGYMKRFMRGQLTESQYWHELKQNYGFTIHDAISDEFKKWHGLVKNDQILDLAIKAKASGKQIAILSNLIEPTYNVLSGAGCYDMFDKVIASCKVGYAKPEIEIYQIALDQLGVSAKQSLFIDDKPANLTPAESLGFTTILALNPQQIIEDLDRYI